MAGNLYVHEQVHVLVGVQTCPTAEDIELLADELIRRGVKIQNALQAQRDGA
jgi:hypothetical protein